MGLKSYLHAMKEDRGAMADIRRGMRDSVPSNALLRHLAASGVDISRDVLPEAMMAYAFSVQGCMDGGVSLGAAVASMERASDVPYSNGSYDVRSSMSQLEKRLYKMVGRTPAECVLECKVLIDRAVGSGTCVDPELLAEDFCAWAEGRDVPMVRWIRSYHRYLHQKAGE